ncbi:hypothetical protein STEG23_009607 [Scotinomys teguina]
MKFESKWMELAEIMLSEVTHTQKDKYGKRKQIKMVAKESKADLCGQGGPLWTRRTSVDKANLCGQGGPLWTRRTSVDKADLCGQGGPLWTRRTSVDKANLCGQGGPLWTRTSVDKADLCGHGAIDQCTLFIHPQLIKELRLKEFCLFQLSLSNCVCLI